MDGIPFLCYLLPPKFHASSDIHVFQPLMLLKVSKVVWSYFSSTRNKKLLFQTLHRALEASLAEKNNGNKRKRGSIWLTFADPENPHDRERKEGVPVGLKNIGNTCWFSAVIQVRFGLYII